MLDLKFLQLMGLIHLPLLERMLFMQSVVVVVEVREVDRGPVMVA
jgi:hypothetical protein